jgi:PAS domain S-box-containing protein
MSPEEFQRLGALLPEPLLLVSEGVVLSANAAARQIFRLDGEAQLGGPLLAWVDEPDAKLAGYLRSCVASPAPVPGGLHFHCADDNKRDEVRAFRVKGLRLEVTNDGPPCIALYCQPRSQGNQGFVLLNRKIDELNAEIYKEQQTAAALERSQAILDGVVNNATAVIYIKDLQGRYMLINRHFEALFGLRNAEVQGKTDFDIFPAENAEAFRANDEEVARTRQSLQMEELAPHEDGMHTYLSVKFPLLDVDGSVYAVGGISTDMTDITAAREQLSRFNEELEVSVAERTRDLEVSNRELEAYSYSIAHDLRAPLRAITGFSQVLQKDAAAKLNEGESDSLQRIVKAGRFMAELIDDILELGRVARVQISQETVDLSHLATTAINRLCELGYESAAAAVRIQPDLQVRGDVRLLGMMLQNLLDNACKYSAEVGSPRIGFGAEQRNGERVYFVRDNGIGFDMQYVDKLFQPFARLHGRDDYPGTGVGLATVQRIVQRHGGRVWVEAAPGEGATFYFTIG